ncbi:MAG TPA: hypothetical protein VFO58_08320 [Vicinamibacterales bacterium]|nr:hypothetical protein [Vicinamibacterales bacterium]
MRTLMRVSFPVEVSNARILDGTLMKVIQKFIADHKPEAVYFSADEHGCRSAAIVLDVKDSSEIPGLAEPWFLAFNAKVSLRPVMNAQDLAAAGPGIERAVQDFKKL